MYVARPFYIISLFGCVNIFKNVYDTNGRQMNSLLLLWRPKGNNIFEYLLFRSVGDAINNHKGKSQP